jgi:transcriptional regulator of arginine metabolism
MSAKEKTSRQEALLELLRAEPFSSQHEVALALERLGYEVTQASVSRDFTELGISKIAGRYMARDEQSGYADFSSLILETETASTSLVVIKTPPGAANMVAARLDSIVIPGVVGTIAGDDTIFVATKGRSAQSRLKALLGTRGKRRG